MADEEIIENVKEYYGNLQSTEDLLTNACCTSKAPPKFISKILNSIHPTVLSKYYGCGFPISPAVEKCSVLDLGCGSGRDVFIFSKLVGEEGSVHGIDMLESILEVANSAVDYQTKSFGYDKPNVTFKHGYIESLEEYYEEGTFDLVVSNCVVNLSPRKDRVLEGVYRILKNGGEFFFSDVFVDRRLSDEARADPVLYGECLSGALYINDFISLAKKCGFNDPRLVYQSEVELYGEVKEKLGAASFESRTYRLFKLEGLEDNCEDYGQIAIYKGTIDNHPVYFNLDDEHLFEAKRPERVCSNTAKMLQETRFQDHFEIIGDTSTHFGPFLTCGTSVAKVGSDSENNNKSSCCG
jgi:SAM-dependent methyltransferase